MPDQPAGIDVNLAPEALQALRRLSQAADLLTARGLELSFWAGFDRGFFWGLLVGIALVVAALFLFKRRQP